LINLAEPVLNRAKRLNDPVIEGFAAIAEGQYPLRWNNSEGTSLGFVFDASVEKGLKKVLKGACN
jgi:hypothetical protein